MMEWGRGWGGRGFGLCLTITILIHHFVLLFSILSQKEKLLCQKKKQYAVKLHDFYSYFMSNKIYPSIYFMSNKIYPSIPIIWFYKRKLHYFE